ncbi:tRNA pseudouridine(55) synthase TruB [Leifsonia shinshuensis]|uniref:tRNA pseudouridine(55) synthase TruB n=1 Tax=Leifsonia shinshuensis TaxID=150026 RepID=UPI001F512DDA|nr:tRNA pseudouridine(55) synthase TruB [Leifsonia shinshuensis]MCI0158572.1 tRNA pseudouridine(55) synthase TruB [Leifsonia shinshuensis]
MTGSGLVLVDKPGGWTSHDVVARVRRLAGTRKVGHAGTLDPMATGLLILGLNSSTRLLTYIVGTDKEYLATIRLGATTTTDDAEGEVTAEADPSAVAAVTDGAIANGIAALTGEIEQVPSSVSAIKVDGKRAYARVRAGEEVVLRPRAVTIERFDLLGVRRLPGDDAPVAIELDVRVVCSSGTYIRSLARDLGADLGVGGHLTALRRTRVGPFDVRDASELDTLDPGAALIPAAQAAAELFERLELTEQQAIDLTHGRRIHVADREGASGAPVAAIAPGGALVGLIEFRGKEARTLVNFPTDEIASS